MGRLRAASSGRASRQYFVMAQRVSRRLSAARVNEIEGWSEAMRMCLEYWIFAQGLASCCHTKTNAGVLRCAQNDTRFAGIARVSSPILRRRLRVTARRLVFGGF